VFILKHDSPEEKLNRLKSVNKNINITKRILITITVLLIIAIVAAAFLEITYLLTVALIQTLVMFYTVYRESKKNKNIANKIRVVEQEYNESMLPVWEKIIEESERELNEISCSRTG
jgi:predicted PurR-regulated permease PerM